MNEREVFIAALQIRDVSARQAYLAEACGTDAAMRQHIEGLLRTFDSAGSFLESPAAAVGATGAFTPEASNEKASVLPRECAGVIIGPYKLLQQIGEGGMGTVYMAEQTQPIQRKVALKVIKSGMDSRQVIARFEAERQALAMMDHVNIARVFDGGTTEADRPYFVMELVNGVPITKYCDDNHLTPRERLELFVPVCQAIQHAHQKGIIHRDIKPSNVMVTLYDGKPVPKVIDFGVAKATEQKLTERTLFTQYGTMVGTLEYMSPEQAEMSALGVDTRSDIYSLGVLLYELLTGNTPLTHKRMKEGVYAEILRMIKEDEPQKPSTRLSDSGEALASISANRHMEPAKLSKLMRGELDWIVMKTLEKDRSRRYETANAFAADLQRYLADETVQACPPSAGYRLRKFARRNKAAIAVAGLVLFFLVLLGSGAGWAMRDRDAREHEAARERADRQGKVAGQVKLILDEVDRLAREQKWPEALAAARRAEAAVAGGEADAATAQRVRELLKDLAFIDQLEQIRDAGEDREYALAFREYGVDVEELAVETSIDRLKTRPALAIPLAAALDEWVTRRQRSLSDAAGSKRLVAIARGVDPEPLRDRIRATWDQPVPEAQDELRRLADSIDVRAHHPATLYRLGDSLRQAELRDAALRILRLAQVVYPGDYWLNTSLGNLLSGDEKIRFLTVAVSLRPSAISGYWNLGIFLHQSGKLDEAIAVCRRGIELNPKHPSTGYGTLGRALFAQNKLDEALAVFRQAVEFHPAGAGMWLRDVGDTLRAQGKPDEAIAVYREAIKIRMDEGGFGIYWCAIGDTLRNQEKLDEAIEAYKKAIELSPQYFPPRHNLGLALHAQKKFDEAIVAFRKAIAIHPQHFESIVSLGKVLNDQGKPEEAIAVLRKAVEAAPKNAHGFLFHLGKALLGQKKIDEAIDYYRKAVEADPKNAAYLTHLGNALLGQKKFDEAIDCYRKVVELNQKDAKAHNNLGTALRDQKMPYDAIACYMRAIELDPKFAHPHNTLGLLLWKDLKDYGKAVECFRKAIELDPKSATAYINLGALLCDELKEYDKAIECFRKAIELDPKETNANRNLGVALGKKGWDLANNPDPKLRDPKRAIESVKEAIELAPQSSQGLQWLGWIQYRIGDWRASIEALEKSCKLQKGGTGDDGQWIVLALAHAKLAAQEGLPEKARAYHRTEARRWFDQADKQIDSRWRVRPGDVMGQGIWDFRAEARELMGVEKKKD